PDGATLAVGTRDGRLQVLSLGEGEPRAALSWAAHIKGVTGLTYTPDGRQIVSRSPDRTLRLWDAATGAALGPPSLGSEPCGLAFGPDGRLFACCSGGWLRTVPSASLLDGQTGSADLAKGDFSNICFTADGRALVCNTRHRLLLRYLPHAAAGPK